MKIIIATDGSAIGDRVADYGVRFAARLGAQVHGVFVVNPKTVELRTAQHTNDHVDRAAEADRERKAGEATLARLASLCAGSGVGVSTSVLTGEPAAEIVRVAGEESADLIVVGNVSKTNIQYMFMGSTSEKVIRNSPCPVLVIRGDMHI